MKFKVISKVLAGAVFGLGMVSANAGSPFGPTTSIDNLFTNDSGSIFVVLDNNSFKPAACATANSYFLPGDTVGSKGLYATLLTAQVSDKQVKLAVDDTNCAPGGYSIIKAVKMF